MGKQVLIIYAATNGFLDQLPVDQCRPFERELYRTFDLQHADLLKQVVEKGLTDESKEALGRAIREVVEQFKAAQPAAAAAAR